MTGRRLIVSGDDFGAAPEVNAAVLRAHREGILTSASLMVNAEAAAAAVAAAREHRRLAVGLHLVLVQGRPVSPPESVPMLIGRRGAFGEQPVTSGFRYAWVRCSRIGRRQLEREIEAQLAAFERTGLPLAHVDGHCNMHLHPMVLPLLVRCASRFGIRAVRLPREDLGPALRHDRRFAGRKTVEQVVFRALGWLARPALRRAGIRCADRVYGMHQTGHVTEAYLLELLPRLPVGVSEVYCHPAERQPPALARYQTGYEHERELAALLSPRVRAALAREGIELITYRDI